MKFWFSVRGVAALALLAGVTYFLLMEHREHFFLGLPYLVFLACPLLHYLMHRNHGHSHVNDCGASGEDAR